MPPKTNEELYEEAERALISEAIGETEQEIFDSAFNNAPDDNDGDTDLEQMDTDDVIDDDIAEDDEDREELPEEGEGEYDDEPPPEKPQAEPQTERPELRIPSSRLKAEAEARRAAEAEARELRARIENLERAQRQPAQPQPQPQQQPSVDMFADPELWAAQERQRILQEVNNQRFNASLADAAEQHGDKFQEAFKAVSGLPNTPENVAIAQRIYNAPNPGRELMKWHQQQSLLSEIGNDPAAYRAKLRDELLSDPDFRKELISGMRQEASGSQRTRFQIPPSLNGASGGTSHRGRDGNSRDTARTNRSLEREIFDSAWDD